MELATLIKQENIKYYGNGNIISFLVALFIFPFAVVLNFIPYLLCKYIAEKTTHRNVFYDSVFFGSLLIFGPVYTIMLAIVGVHFTHSIYGLLLPIISMLSAWSYAPSKRNIYCFIHRKKIAKASVLLSELFGKDNG